MDFHKICRTCLGEVRNSKSLFNLKHINDEQLKLSEILTACTSIEVLENDNLPKEVCIQCENNILNTFKFQEQCHKSNSVLKAIFSNSVQSELTRRMPLDNIEEVSLKSSIQQSSNNTFEQGKLVNEVDQFNSSLAKAIKIELAHTESSSHSFTEEHDENNLSSSFHTDSVHAQHTELKPSGISSEHIFKQDQVNNLDEALNSQLTSVKILKEDNDGVEMDFRDEGHIEYVSCSFIESDHGGCQQILDPNDSPNEVEDEALQLLFSCDARGCVAYFTTLEALKEHSKKHLPQTKTHLCSICGKGFPRLCGPRSLARHMKIHTGSNNFICEFCKKCFTTARNLTVHKKTHKVQ